MANQNVYLASGTYSIQSAVQNGAFMAPQALLDVSGIVITEESLPFKWEVFLDNNQYTIQIEQNIGYAVAPKNSAVWIEDQKQLYYINAVSAKDNKTCYEILTTDNYRFKYNGNDKAVTTVKDGQGEDFLWFFNDFGAGIPNPSRPYKVYSENYKYFRYDGISERFPILDRFGLWDASDDRWQKFWKIIDKLNNDAKGDKLYKVIFLGRHGQATNNIGHKKRAPDLPLRDAPLTQKGYIQSSNVQAVWTEENSLNGGGIGIPQISYCSPLTRCLATNSITFAPQLDADGGPKIHTVVHEDCRERCSTHETEHRLSKACISQMFPKFALEPHFAPDDPLWGVAETSSSVHNRAREILDRIFKTESQKKRFVSITGHAGINSAILSTLGWDHRSFKLVNGGVIPVICEYTIRETTLSDGLYRIQYVPQPSLFANGYEISIPVLATDDKHPTIWYVQKITAYANVFPPIDTGDNGYPTLNIGDNVYAIKFWGYNAKWYSRALAKEDPKYVELSTHQSMWRLIPAGNTGEYYIKWVRPDKDLQSPDTVTVKYVNGVVPNGSPLILRNEDDLEYNTTPWRFLPALPSLAFCGLYLEDIWSEY